MHGYRLIPLLLALVLPACSEPPDQEARQQPKPGSADHVWKAQLQAIDKAKQVEQTLLDAERRRAGQIEQQQ